MNTSCKILLSAALAWGVTWSALAEASKNPPAKTATTNASAKVIAARSAFVTPSNVREGRDPFFPESSRVYDANVQVNPNHRVEATSLVVKGVSKIAGRLFVIINNHTFTGGDESDVLTATGKAHVRCVEIRSDSVVVELNGQRHVLSFKTSVPPGK